MNFYVQIFLCVLSLHYVTSKPFLGELSFKKNFDVSFKPPPLPPLKLSFLKELWTPFGKFNSKHAIEKRDLDSIKSMESKSEEDDDMYHHAIPENRYEVIEPKIDLPRGSTPLPYLSTPTIVIIKPSPSPHRPVMGPELHVSSARPPQYGWVPIGTPVPVVTPVAAPPNPPVVITPPPPPPKPVAVRLVPNYGPGFFPAGLYSEPLARPRGALLNTDIGREELINEYLKTVEREGPPPVAPLPPITDNTLGQEKPKPLEPKAPEPENPFVKGGRLALFFGNFLLDALSRFVGVGLAPPPPEGAVKAA